MSANTLITSIVTGGTNTHTTTAEEANALATDFVTQGVVGAITLNSGSGGTGSFCVNADGTPDMGVTIKSGQAYVAATPSSQDSQVLRVRASSDYTAFTINANSSGSAKYDWIYLKIDSTKANDPAADASDVASIYASRSSSNTTDNGTPPTYGLLLAVVAVANGASSITNSNITDKRFNSSIGAQNGSLIVSQQATGDDAIVQAAGIDANVSVKLVAKGTGVVKFSGLQTQAVAANTNVTGAFEQMGWSFVNANAVASTTKAITLPVTFPNAILQVQVGVVGARTSSDPAAVTEFNVAIGGEQITASATSISTTGFTVQLTKSTNFASGTRYGFWWRALGN
jgi:hypothetical protein